MAKQEEQVNILIIGAGLAGLCAAIALSKTPNRHDLGYKITILESHAGLSEVGAGIHVPSNAAKLLRKWGLSLHGAGGRMKGFAYRRYEDGEVLKKLGFGEEEGEYWTMKRRDYQRVLFEEVEKLEGVNVRFGVRVVDVLDSGVRLEDGEMIEADLVIAADGIKSKIRETILPGEDVNPTRVPWETYRAMAFTQDLDPKDLEMLEQGTANVFLGPNRHVIIYPASNGEILSINGTHSAPQSSDQDSWSKPACIPEILHSFRDFSPTISSILEKAQDYHSYSLAEVPKLSRWISISGRIVLIGDAAHGMLQFLAQGAAMATEDAAVIAECIARIRSKEQIEKAMEVYERSRKLRCEIIQEAARRNGEAIHMVDGDEQQERDRVLKGELEEGEGNVGPMMEKKFREWMFGVDVVGHTRELLDEAGF